MPEQVKNGHVVRVYWPMFVQADEHHIQKRKSPVRKPGIFHTL